MRYFTCFLLPLLSLAVWAQPPEMPDKVAELEADLKAEKGEQYCRTECLILEKLIHFRIPAECWPMMLVHGSTDGGGRRMSYLTGAIVEYMNADDPANKALYNLAYDNQMAPVVQAVEAMVPRLSFTYIYNGPAEQKAWSQGMWYEGQVENILSGYYHRWQPKSGVAHITLTIDPKAKLPSCSSDGSRFNITAPAYFGVTDDVWNAKVASVFEKYKK
ncbi:MAG: hypothetical protein U0931_21145 [Vulcanimicrobiota bacterium]